MSVLTLNSSVWYNEFDFYRKAHDGDHVGFYRAVNQINNMMIISKSVVDDFGSLHIVEKPSVILN